MLPGATNDLLDRLEALGIPKPPDGTLAFRQEDDWNTAARTILDYIFGLARGGRLPIGVEQPAVAVLLRHFAVTCSCGQVVGFPTSCPQCSRRIN